MIFFNVNLVICFIWRETFDDFEKLRSISIHFVSFHEQLCCTFFVVIICSFVFTIFLGWLGYIWKEPLIIMSNIHENDIAFLPFGRVHDHCRPLFIRNIKPIWILECLNNLFSKTSKHTKTYGCTGQQIDNMRYSLKILLLFITIWWTKRNFFD